MSSFGVIDTLAAGFALSNVYETEANAALSRIVLLTSTLVVCMNMAAITIISAVYYLASRMLATSPTAANDSLMSIGTTRHMTFRLTLGSVSLFIFSCVALAVEKTDGILATMISTIAIGVVTFACMA